MTKSKNTKRALLASVLSMLLCVAMLVGSTFAWFTDSVTSGKNKIVAGNLDIELNYRNASMTSFKEVKADTEDLFVTKEGEVIRWEPGAAAVTYLELKNAGNLALKYQLSVDAADTVTGTDGAALSKVLKTAVVEITEAEVGTYDRATAVGKAEAADAEGILTYSKPGEMETQGQVKYLAMIVYFPAEIGNTYEGGVYNRSDVELETELSLNLVATQNTVESDSFGKDYDASAEYPVATVGGKGYSDLASAIAAAQEGDTIKLMRNMETPLILADKSVAIKDITIDGNGVAVPGITMSTVKTSVKINNLTVKNLVFTEPIAFGSFAMGYPIVNGLTFDNCVFDLSASTNTKNFGISLDSGTGKDKILENVTVKNCHFKGARRGINLSKSRNLTVENCIFENCSAAAIKITDVFGDFIVRDNTIRSGKTAVDINTVANNYNATDYDANVVITGNVMTNMAGTLSDGQYYALITGFDNGRAAGKSTYTIEDNYYGGAEGIVIAKAFRIKTNYGPSKAETINDVAPRASED